MPICMKSHVQTPDVFLSPGRVVLAGPLVAGRTDVTMMAPSRPDPAAAENISGVISVVAWAATQTRPGRR